MSANLCLRLWPTWAKAPEMCLSREMGAKSVARPAPKAEEAALRLDLIFKATFRHVRRTKIQRGGEGLLLHRLLMLTGEPPPVKEAASVVKPYIGENSLVGGPGEWFKPTFNHFPRHVRFTFNIIVKLHSQASLS